MDELLRFREWADKIGHYRIVEGVDRYLAMLETPEYKELQSSHYRSFMTTMERENEHTVRA